jgi:hypothetical protein
LASILRRGASRLIAERAEEIERYQRARALGEAAKSEKVA